MDETKMLIEKIIRATEQRKIKWNYKEKVYNETRPQTLQILPPSNDER